MALVLKDRVRETSIDIGTSTITLLGAVTGYQTFNAAIGSGNTCYYTIYNQGTNEWEVGIGTVGTGTLSRDVVLESSNSGSLVNFSAGTKDVFVTYPAEKSVNLDSSGNVSALGTVSSGTWQGTAIANNYLANSSITINGNSVSLGGTTTVTANTPNSLTINNSGSGAASPATFNGGSAVTISYNTLGASPLAGSSSLTTVGTIGSGTWNGATIGTGYGGTGLTSFTSGGAVYASSTSALTTGTLPVTAGGTGTATAFTTGSIVFAGGSGVYTQNNSKLFWDNTNYRIGLNTATPAVSLAVSATDAVLIPVGTTAERPTGATGYIRYNTDISKYEGYSGSTWSSLGGGATGGGSDEIFIENGQNVTTSYTIPSTKNAMSTGPITINSGAVVTVPSGSRWVVL